NGAVVASSAATTAARVGSDRRGSVSVSGRATTSTVGRAMLTRSDALAPGETASGRSVQVARLLYAQRRATSAAAIKCARDSSSSASSICMIRLLTTSFPACGVIGSEPIVVQRSILNQDLNPEP